MALGDRDQKIYIGTFKGNFIRKAKAGDKKIVERVNKLGKAVKEIHFTRIDAFLTDIKYKDGYYGRQDAYYLKDGEEEYILQAAVKSGLASSVINRLPNLNLAEKMQFAIGYNNEREKAWHTVGQDDSNVDDYFNTWDDDNKVFVQHHDFPKWEQKVVNGEKMWDATEQLKYQEKVVERYIDEIRGEKPITAEPEKEMPDQAHHGEPVAAVTPMTPTKKDIALSNKVAKMDEEDDDLPF
jgi:hypothetical protein